MRCEPGRLPAPGISVWIFLVDVIAHFAARRSVQVGGYQQPTPGH
jgi:hypothetical protein